MALQVTKQAALPAGKNNRGIIMSAVETTAIFNPSEGPKPVVEVTIQPAWKKDADTQTLPLTVSFSPIINGISAFSRFLARIKRYPTGESFEVTSIDGTEVIFDTVTKNDFTNIDKDTIRAA